MGEDSLQLLRASIGSLQSSSINEDDRFLAELILIQKLTHDRKNMLRQQGLTLSNTYMQKLLLLSNVAAMLIHCLSSGLEGMDRQEWLNHVLFAKEQYKRLVLEW